MKVFIKLMLLIVVAAVAAPFFILGPDGRPLWSLDGLHAPSTSLPSFSGVEDSVKESVEETVEAPAKPVEVFKWQDENGVWHYSDIREQGRPAQSMTVNPNAGVVHLEPIRNPDREEAPAAVEDNNDHPVPSAAIAPTSLPYANIPKLIGDSKNLQRLQQDRLSRQERAMQD